MDSPYQVNPVAALGVISSTLPTSPGHGFDVKLVDDQRKQIYRAGVCLVVCGVLSQFCTWNITGVLSIAAGAVAIDFSSSHRRFVSRLQGQVDCCACNETPSTGANLDCCAPYHLPGLAISTIVFAALLLIESVILVGSFARLDCEGFRNTYDNYYYFDYVAYCKRTRAYSLVVGAAGLLFGVIMMSAASSALSTYRRLAKELSGTKLEVMLTPVVCTCCCGAGGGGGRGSGVTGLSRAQMMQLHNAGVAMSLYPVASSGQTSAIYVQQQGGYAAGNGAAGIYNVAYPASYASAVSGGAGAVPYATPVMGQSSPAAAGAAGVATDAPYQQQMMTGAAPPAYPTTVTL